jgi:regulator of protease activity HflC (stomatin/prohibitin superfamily)
MLLLKDLLLISGFGLLTIAAAILLWDLYTMIKARKLISELEPTNHARPPIRMNWGKMMKLICFAIPALLIGSAIAVVPSGMAGVAVNQFAGAREETLYPGIHIIWPIIETVQLFNVRDQIFTSTIDDSKKKDGISIQTREGLSAAVAVAVRYRIQASKLPYLYANLPQPVETQIVNPIVGSVFRELAPHYLVREVFSTKREALTQEAAKIITAKLASDAIQVKEVTLRDIQLPAEYARGLEGLLLKEQENEGMTIELELKQKAVRTAQLEAEAQKARVVKDAEARAEVTVLQAKAQADAMQHTLPLKEKQIQQSRLEAQARKESTVMNAEAQAQAKVIDGKAELERRKLMSDGDQDHIHKVGLAETDRMRLEASVLKDNPLLIQKIIAEKLSEKVQIMMVPNDGKFFFANDVLKGSQVTALSGH